MVQCMGRSKRSESKGRLLTGWWKGTFGLIALLGLLMGVMVAQVKPPERERLLERSLKGCREDAHLTLSFASQQVLSLPVQDNFPKS